jgi:hypothetical protein
MKNEPKTGKPLGPRWRPPATAEAGDELTYYTAAATFELVVTRLAHGGDWVVGRKVGEHPDSKLGPVIVPLSDCMTPAQARTVLRNVRHPDTIGDTVVTHDAHNE